MRITIPGHLLKVGALCALMCFLAASPLTAARLCIDPGHGASDPGAVGYLVESGINLDAGNKLKHWLDLDTRDRRGGSNWDVS